MTFMIRTARVGSCQLRKKYVSVMSAAGSSAIGGASRWLAARAPGTPAPRLRTASSAAAGRTSQWWRERDMAHLQSERLGTEPYTPLYARPAQSDCARLHS